VAPHDLPVARSSRPEPGSITAQQDGQRQPTIAIPAEVTGRGEIRAAPSGWEVRPSKRRTDRTDGFAGCLEIDWTVERHRVTMQFFRSHSRFEPGEEFTELYGVRGLRPSERRRPYPCILKLSPPNLPACLEDPLAQEMRVFVRTITNPQGQVHSVTPDMTVEQLIGGIHISIPDHPPIRLVSGRRIL